MSQIYLEGWGVDVNPKIAISYLNKVIENLEYNFSILTENFKSKENDLANVTKQVNHIHVKKS